MIKHVGHSFPDCGLNGKSRWHRLDSCLGYSLGKPKYCDRQARAGNKNNCSERIEWVRCCEAG